MGWGGRREAQVGGKYVYTWLIHVIVQHKIIQYCKAIKKTVDKLLKERKKKLVNLEFYTQ